MARGRYLSSLGNTPGHIQHWSARRFAGLVGSELDILSVRTPFPWTMIGARSRRLPLERTTTRPAGRTTTRREERATARPLDRTMAPTDGCTDARPAASSAR